ncbi:MAG TPA: TonB-dependent receptor [Candidatus Eisenbacteria bacterium]
MWNRVRGGLRPAWMLAVLASPALAATDADTVAMTHEPSKYQIVISATKISKDVAEIPNAASVVSGDELRRRGTRTVAEALQDVVGLDTGEGSDNGMRLPNIGMWGLKEFDALLVTVDGVPVGGPFNPSLAQIPVEDIDRIEIVNGPQGTLYGVSAFAGMISVFTRSPGQGGRRGSVTFGGGSFTDGHGAADLERSWSHGASARLSGAIQRSDGWQDETGSAIDRGSLSLDLPVGPGTLGLDLSALRHTQRWGTPLPYASGTVVPGFVTDRNYAVGGARLDHHVVGLSSLYKTPLSKTVRLENTLGLTRDDQYSLRSFTDAGLMVGDTVPSEGVELRPLETTAYEDARAITAFDAAGRHELVGGAALTWGRTTADGRGFDFDQVVGDPASIPSAGQVPTGDLRSFEDRRTFVGFYAHDAWTPRSPFTISGGGRYDRTSERLHARAQEQSPLGPLEVTDDSRDDGAWSGDIAGLVRLVARETPLLSTANVYANYRSSFKPAAPNLAEAEQAEILEPERTHAVEAGFKGRGLGRQVSLDVSWFDMTFDNLVVSVVGPGGGPALTNAGRERFEGIETALVCAPERVPGTSLTLGYAHHDARFVDFTFVTPDSQIVDVSGNRLELVPQDLASARLDVSASRGLGLFAAVRYQGERPLNRRNTTFTDAFAEWDLGASFERGPLRVSVVGRNLGDDRHIVSESDIGDSQFYVAAPRRVAAEARWEF